MTDADQKKQWKEDADQLKSDLEKRQKKVVQREVELKFGPGRKKATPISPPPPVSSPSQDEELRRRLGL